MSSDISGSDGEPLDPPGASDAASLGSSDPEMIGEGRDRPDLGEPDSDDVDARQAIVVGFEDTTDDDRELQDVGARLSQRSESIKSEDENQEDTTEGAEDGTWDEGVGGADYGDGQRDYPDEDHVEVAPVADADEIEAVRPNLHQYQEERSDGSSLMHQRGDPSEAMLLPDPSGNALGTREVSNDDGREGRNQKVETAEVQDSGNEFERVPRTSAGQQIRRRTEGQALEAKNQGKGKSEPGKEGGEAPEGIGDIAGMKKPTPSTQVEHEWLAKVAKESLRRSSTRTVDVEPDSTQSSLRARETREMVDHASKSTADAPSESFKKIVGAQGFTIAPESSPAPPSTTTALSSGPPSKHFSAHQDVEMVARQPTSETDRPAPKPVIDIVQEVIDLKDKGDSSNKDKGGTETATMDMAEPICVQNATEETKPMALSEDEDTVNLSKNTIFGQVLSAPAAPAPPSFGLDISESPSRTNNAETPTSSCVQRSVFDTPVTFGGQRSQIATSSGTPDNIFDKPVTFGGRILGPATTGAKSAGPDKAQDSSPPSLAKKEAKEESTQGAPVLASLQRVDQVEDTDRCRTERGGPAVESRKVISDDAMKEPSQAETGLEQSKVRFLDRTKKKKEAPESMKSGPTYTLDGVKLLLATTEDSNDKKTVLKPYADSFDVKLYQDYILLESRGATNRTIRLPISKAELRVAKLMDTESSRNRGIVLTRLKGQAWQNSTVDNPGRIVVRTDSPEKTSNLLAALRNGQTDERMQSPNFGSSGGATEDISPTAVPKVATKLQKKTKASRKQAQKKSKQALDKENRLKAQRAKLLQEMKTRKGKSKKLKPPAPVSPVPKLEDQAQTKKRRVGDTQPQRHAERPQKKHKAIAEDKKGSKVSEDRQKDIRQPDVQTQDQLPPKKFAQGNSANGKLSGADDVGKEIPRAVGQSASIKSPKDFKGPEGAKPLSSLDARVGTRTPQKYDSELPQSLESMRPGKTAGEGGSEPMEVCEPTRTGNEIMAERSIPGNALVRLKALEAELLKTKDAVERAQKDLSLAEARAREASAAKVREISAIRESIDGLKESHKQYELNVEKVIKNGIASIVSELSGKYLLDQPVTVRMECRPWSREDFFERLGTFKPSNWYGFCAVGKIDPVECARHGWYNSGKNTLSSTEGAQIEYDADSTRVRELILVKGHAPMSPWVGAPCPEDFRSLGPMTLDKPTLRKRAEALRMYLGDEELSTCSAQMTQHFKGDAALAIAGYLWNVEKGGATGAVLRCDWCGAKRRLTSSQELRFHPLNSHYVWCPVVVEDAWKLHRDTLKGEGPYIFASTPMEVESSGRDPASAKIVES